MRKKLSFAIIFNLNAMSGCDTVISQTTDELLHKRRRTNDSFNENSLNFDNLVSNRFICNYSITLKFFLQ